MNYACDNIVEYSHSPDEGFLSMEDSSYQIVPFRPHHQCQSDNAICSGQITDSRVSLRACESYICGVCAECGENIMEQYYLGVNGQFWHLSCLRCAICQCDLQWESSCFSYKGSLICRADYQGRSECRVCERRFKKEDWVHTFHDGRSFHCECLRCQRCGREMQKSDGFFNRQKTVLCLSCHHKPQKRKLSNNNSPLLPPTPTPTTSLNPVIPPISSRIPQPEGENRREQNRPSSGTSATSENPQKRHRTSFKQAQLEIMKDYFRTNQNPDQKELLHLAEKTSLTKRTLQVWFQNARANFRRRLSNTAAGNTEATTSQNSSISGSTPVEDFESANDH